MNPWREIRCPRCGQRARFDPETLVLVDHRRYLSILPSAKCQAGGKSIDPSLLPGWHPKHECGTFCDGSNSDGQLLLYSDCLKERVAGPPDAVDALGDLVDG